MKTGSHRNNNGENNVVPYASRLVTPSVIRLLPP